MEGEITLKELLRDEIAVQIKKMGSLQVGSKEHAMAAKAISELYKALSAELDSTCKMEEANAKLAIEQEKNDRLYQLEKEKANREYRLNVQKFEHERKTKKQDTVSDYVYKGLDIGLKIFGIMMPLMFYGTWLDSAMEFERSDTWTCNANRSFFGKLKPLGDQK